MAPLSGVNPMKNKQLPKIYRFISEPFKVSFPKLNPVKLFKLYRRSLKIFIVFIFLFAVLIVGLDLQENIKTKQNIDRQRDNLTKELKFWKSFIAEHKDYRDAYFQASILEYKLGKIDQAKISVEKGLSLDPNSENGRKIEEFLNK